MSNSEVDESEPMHTGMSLCAPTKARKKPRLNESRPVLPECFHLVGEYANCIVDTAGICIKTSVPITYYEDVTDSNKKDYNSHYFQYIGRYSTTALSAMR